jgi:hypothetical protein
VGLRTGNGNTDSTPAAAQPWKHALHRRNGPRSTRPFPGAIDKGHLISGPRDARRHDHRPLRSPRRRPNPPPGGGRRQSAACRHASPADGHHGAGRQAHAREEELTVKDVPPQACPFSDRRADPRSPPRLGKQVGKKTAKAREAFRRRRQAQRSASSLSEGGAAPPTSPSARTTPHGSRSPISSWQPHDPQQDAEACCVR